MYPDKNHMRLSSVFFTASIARDGDTGERVIVATVLRAGAVQSTLCPQDSGLKCVARCRFPRCSHSITRYSSFYGSLLSRILDTRCHKLYAPCRDQFHIRPNNR